MDVAEIAIVRFDFALSFEGEDIESGLEDWFGTEGDSYFEASFSHNQSSESIHFSSSGKGGESPVNELEHFTAIETSVVQQTRYFSDIITVGILSEKEKEKILTQDNGHDILDSWRGDLKSISDYVPLLADDGQSSNEIIQVIPEDEWEVFDENGELRLDYVHKKLEDASESLGNINYNLLGFISLFTGLGGNHVVVPQYPNQIWGPLISIQTQKVNQSQTHSPWLPAWVRTLRMLTPHFRSYQWLNCRMDQAGTIDSETHDMNEIMDIDVGNPSKTNLEDLMESEIRLARLRRDWTNLYTQITDELEELKGVHSDIFSENSNNLDYPEVPETEAAIRIPKPQLSGLMVGENSLLDIYRETLRERFNNIESTLERVGQKQSQISGFIHDELTAKATQANLKLQERITKLTWVLIILTIILVLDSFGVI